MMKSAIFDVDGILFISIQHYYLSARLCQRRIHLTKQNRMSYRDIITIEPEKRGGKPCVRGLRITVYEVLEYLASEMTEAEILDDFPDLTQADLKACIAYAADRERRFMTAPLSA